MTERARSLRNDPTEAEKKLWSVLRRDRLGVRFRRQIVIGRRYILDFYAPSLRFAIEVDGGQHAAGAQRDAVRTAFLVSDGVTVLRFWNNEVLENTDGVTAAIAAVVGLLDTASPLAPLPAGGGKELVPEVVSSLRIDFGDNA